MKVFSSAFKDGEWIPKKYSARGENISPDLQITELPEDTISLVITLDDSSHPLFPNYNHWVIWNIPSCKAIPEGIEKGKYVQKLGNAVQGMAYGKHCYKGPKPPLKTIHQYTFTVFAIDTMLDLLPSDGKEQVMQAIEGHILEKAILTGKFQSHRKE